ncbi:exonuclease domain-containing protein [Streptomyces tendae]|uniref:exonuclease domain-containing protein n=1 Tax=Streptomyces tendae TaxID=1932 RepID=UPI00364F86F3
MSTTTATEAEIPASRTEADPARVAKGKPLDHTAGVPVYGWGQAPPYLRTKTQLAADRLNTTEEQERAPLAYVRTRDYGDVPLHDPAAAVKMKPLPSSTKAKMAARRTCPECGTVCKVVLHGRPCSACRERAEKERQRLLARTCAGCSTVRERPYPKEHRRCQTCRHEQLQAKRERVEAWLVEVTVCVGDDCTTRLGSKTRARAWLKERAWLLNPERTGLPDSSWWPDWSRRCPPCATAYEQEQARIRAEYQERYERQEQERAERERQAAAARVRWAAEALVDPDVVVLDTETTGLDDDARIVELAVLSSAGEVLLDTLVDPGEPIPAGATAIHGITDSDVAGAPRFPELVARLAALLNGKRVLIYNKWYDVGVLRHELTLHYLDRAAQDAAGAGAGVELSVLREQAVAAANKQATAWLEALNVEDVMIPYSDWVGDWSEYHGNNRWQPLQGGHRAAGDCRAVLDCLRAMGRSNERLAAVGGLDEGEAA